MLVVTVDFGPLGHQYQSRFRTKSMVQSFSIEMLNKEKNGVVIIDEAYALDLIHDWKKELIFARSNC